MSKVNSTSITRTGNISGSDGTHRTGGFFSSAIKSLQDSNVVRKMPTASPNTKTSYTLNSTGQAGHS